MEKAETENQGLLDQLSYLRNLELLEEEFQERRNFSVASKYLKIWREAKVCDTKRDFFSHGFDRCWDKHREVR